MSVSLRSFTTIQRGKGERGRKSIELASSANVRTNTMLAFSPTKKEMEKRKENNRWWMWYTLLAHDMPCASKSSSEKEHLKDALLFVAGITQLVAGERGQKEPS